MSPLLWDGDEPRGPRIDPVALFVWCVLVCWLVVLIIQIGRSFDG